MFTNQNWLYYLTKTIIYIVYIELMKSRHIHIYLIISICTTLCILYVCIRYCSLYRSHIVRYMCICKSICKSILYISIT